MSLSNPTPFLNVICVVDVIIVPLIMRMCKQCVPGLLSPPTQRPGYEASQPHGPETWMDDWSESDVPSMWLVVRMTGNRNAQAFLPGLKSVMPTACTVARPNTEEDVCVCVCVCVCVLIGLSGITRLV